MREIKFRAWDNVNETMVDPKNIAIHCDGELWIKVGTYMAKQDSSQFDIQQFTGLLDKQGIEIYEGDIVKSRKDITHIIKYDEDSARFVAVFNKSDNKNDDACHISKQWIEMYQKEVIGNIYEHGHLLETK